MRLWKTLGIFFKATLFPFLGSVTDLNERINIKKNVVKEWLKYNNINCRCPWKLTTLRQKLHNQLVYLVESLVVGVKCNVNCGSPSTAVVNASRGTPWKPDSCIQPLKTRRLCCPSHSCSMVLTYALEALHVQQFAERGKEKRFRKEAMIPSRIPLRLGSWCGDWICRTFERTCAGVADLFCARVTQHPLTLWTLGKNF